MSLSPLETVPIAKSPEDVIYDNYFALHGLIVALNELDTSRKGELVTLLGQFRLPPYTVPRGQFLLVEPFSRHSREVPLSLAKRRPWSDEWSYIPPTSDEYRSRVSYDKEFDEFFRAHILQQDDDGQVHAYLNDGSNDGSVRVHINHQTRFRRVGTPDKFPS